MISVQIECDTCFWVESAGMIRRILDAADVCMQALYALGYTSGPASVFGGVDEVSHTGYASFTREYASYGEMRERLCPDYEAAMKRAPAEWIDALNFETLTVSVKKNGGTGGLTYSRGFLTLSLSSAGDEAEAERRCRDAIRPHLYS